MTNYALPPIQKIEPLPLNHFPTRMQTVIFRMWETVAAQRIAEVLGMTVDAVRKVADDMGLPPQKHLEEWQTKGYITTIRNLWCILPYEQIIQALGWTEQQFAEVLVNDDFLAIKLGGFTPFKPYCEPVGYEELTAEQQEQTAVIKKTMQSTFASWFDGALPFHFFDNEVVTEGTTVGDDEAINMVYSFCGLYRNVLDEDINISYPEALLAKYRQMGVNTVWLPAVLYQLVEFPFKPSYSEGFEERQNRLRELIARAAKYGIKVCLYLNEPRSMPAEFFEEYPDMKGASMSDGGTAMCLSDPRVLEYLKQAVESLCRSVPGLGGFFLINFSENLTHCKSNAVEAECPRCRHISAQAQTAAVIRTISEAAVGIDPSIKILAYTWSWKNFIGDAAVKELIADLPKNVVIMAVSEWGKEFCIGGVNGKVGEYSISIPGPSEENKKVWRYAKESGHDICAKVALNNTWECSTVPFFPAYDLLREHMANLHDEGITNLMLSWTLGGYPSFNLKLAIEYLKKPTEETYQRLLEEEYGEFAPCVKAAASKFSAAFRHFPTHINVLYFGPQNAGPSNLLYEKNTGWKATMTCYPFDDIEKWRGNFPMPVFIEQLRALNEGWKEGLADIEHMPDCDFKDAAFTGYALFRSSYLQAQFILNRESGDRDLLGKILDEERDLAMLVYGIMQRNNAIGYEAANHYYFSKGMLIEKVLCCEYLKEKMVGREK